MPNFQVFLHCTTPTAVTFVLPILAQGESQEEAARAAIGAVIKNGGAVQLRPDGPLVQCPVLLAIPVRIEPARAEVELASSIPVGIKQ